MKMTAPMEVGLIVSDLARMRDFYENGLGFQFVSEVYVGQEKSRQAAMSSSGGYKALRLQTSYGERLKLLEPDTKPQIRHDIDPDVLTYQHSIYLTFIVEDIEKTVADVIAAGGTLMTQASSMEVRPGTYLAFLRDPEGHIVEIVQYQDIAAYRPDIYR